jgi:hypothetical protein
MFGVNIIANFHFPD